MFHAEITNDRVTLRDGNEEIAHWTRDEWQEYPDLILAVVNAVTIGYTQGADAVRDLLDLLEGR